MNGKLEELSRRVVTVLIEQKKTISTMESCTGGLIASYLTDTEGASAIFPGGFVTYSNEGKISAGVPASTIASFGIYSKETAIAMAGACKESYGTDIGIGVTGSFGNVDPNNADSQPGQVDYCILFGKEEIARHLTLDCTLSRNEAKRQVAEVIFRELSTLLIP